MFHVCIVGVGITILFLAMLLDQMHPFITYEILKSSPRVGERVYTHWFPRDSVSAWVWREYYDVGAMRFPDVCSTSLMICNGVLTVLDPYNGSVGPRSIAVIGQHLH